MPLAPKSLTGQGGAGRKRYGCPVGSATVPALAHQVYGPRDGPPILLVHGFPFDRRMWRFQANALATAGLRVIAPDLAGFGQSDGAGHTSMDAHAKDLLALLDHLHVPKASVCGFSMGGYVALAVAAAASERLDGLVLIDTRAGTDSEEGRAKRDAAIADVEAHGTRTLVAKQLEAQLTEATRRTQRLLAAEVRDLMLRQPKASVVAALQAMRDRPDRLPMLRQLKAPALVLVGAHDKVTPPEAAKEMAGALLNAELRVIEGAAHLSPMERPHDVNAALIEWAASP
jgi:pimeloyl-ACP methyl ester carboxylesterase